MSTNLTLRDKLDFVGGGLVAVLSAFLFVKSVVPELLDYRVEGFDRTPKKSLFSNPTNDTGRVEGEAGLRNYLGELVEVVNDEAQWYDGVEGLSSKDRISLADELGYSSFLVPEFKVSEKFPARLVLDFGAYREEITQGETIDYLISQNKRRVL